MKFFYKLSYYLFMLIMTPEQLAREHIDELLSKAGWTIQNVSDLNLGASLGVAIREYQTNSTQVITFSLSIE